MVPLGQQGHDTCGKENFDWSPGIVKVKFSENPQIGGIVQLIRHCQVLDVLRRK